MRKIVRIIGILWIGGVIAFCAWLGFAQLFLDKGGIFFESGFGDIWILAACAFPGYLLFNWGDNGAGSNEAENETLG